MFRPPSLSPSLRRNIEGHIPTYAPTSVPSHVPRILDVTYHNGTVMVGPTLNVYHIYFGRFSNASRDLMDYFGG